MTVQRRTGPDVWATVLTDSDWETKFRWIRPAMLLPYSFATLEWAITPGTPPGDYRIQYIGKAREMLGSDPVPIAGVSSVFTVVQSSFTHRHDTTSTDAHDHALNTLLQRLRENHIRDTSAADAIRAL